LGHQNRNQSFVNFNKKAFSTAGISINSSIDYYGVLKLSRTANPKQVRLAYFNLAKKHHPDLN